MGISKYLKPFSRSKKKVSQAPKLHSEMTTAQLFRRYLLSKIPKVKEAAINKEVSLINALPQNKVNHIAVILDGKVEEVIRAQNRLAALLLSDPEFVEFNPAEVAIRTGVTDYTDGKFITPLPPEHNHPQDEEQPEGSLGYKETNVFEKE